MPVVLRRPAISSRFIMTDEVRRTVKFVSRDRVAVTDLLMMIQAQGVDPKELVSLYRGAPSDPAFYVSFKDEASVTLLKSKDSLTYRNSRFYMVALGAQTVTLRIHWLPCYFSDDLLREELDSFGNVLSIVRAESRDLVNGVRVVQLECSEEQRLAIPHLIEFGCGASALLTMQGRPPLCLRCQGLGHVRRDCPLAQRSFSQVVDSNRRQEPPTLQHQQQQQVPQPQRPVDTDIDDDDKAEENVSQEQQPPSTEQQQPVEEQPLPLDSSAIDVSSNLVIDLSPTAGNSSPLEQQMEVVTPSLKRSFSEGETDSFRQEFPPQKAVRSAPLDTSNKYQMLEDLSTLLEDV